MKPILANDRAAVGHPVDVATGVVYTAATDWVLRGDVPCRWRRFYSTASVRPTPLGNGWFTEWFMVLNRAEGAAVLTDDEGRPVPFHLLPDGTRRINASRRMELLDRAGCPVVYDWGRFRRYVFEPSAAPGLFRLAAIENLAGDRVAVRYDAAGTIREIAAPGGRRVLVDRDDAGRIVRVGLVRDDGSFHVFASYAHDEAGNLVEARDACGRATRYEYDGAGRLVRETNGVGGSFYFEYDESGRCVRTWGDGGYLERRLEYDEAARRVRVTDSRGATTVYRLGPHGGIASVTDAAGGTTRFVSAGTLVQRVDPRGGVWLREIDVFGNTVREVDPTGAETTYEYNELQQCVARTNPEGNRWEFRYTPEGFPSGATDAAGHTWSFECDRKGRIIRVVNPLGAVTRFAYDRFGNIAERIDPDGLSVRSVHDDLGHLVRREDRAGNEVRYEYDPCGRLTRVTSRGRVLLAWRYDAEGRAVSVTGRTGEETRFEYTPWGQRIREIPPRLPFLPDDSPPPCFSYEYDTEGNLAALSTPSGERYRFSYDPSNRLAEVTSPDGTVETFRRDAAGNVVEYRRGQIRILYEYDAANRLVAKTPSHGVPVRYSYDAMGRLVEADGGDAAVTFGYDAMGNPVEERQGDRSLHRAYDAMGNRTALSVPGFAHVECEYDANGRVAAIRGPLGHEHFIEYGPGLAGPAVHRFANGLVERLSCDPAEGALDQIVATAGSAGTGVVSRRRYLFDAAGRVAAEVDRDAGARKFSYDSWGRLVGVDREYGPPERYDFDLAGNIVRDARRGARRYGPGGRLLADATGAYVYAEDGLRLERVEPDGRRTEFRFDAEGRLRAATGPDGRVTEYRYDALGRRIAKSSGGGMTRYLWDGTALLAEENDGDVDLYANIPASFRAVAKIRRRREGEPELYCYHLDLLGTPREMTDRAGRIAWKGEHTAFGETTVTAGDPALNRFVFPGQYLDDETGLHYNVYRYYDPRNGRYISEDPIGLSGGSPNLFAYPADPVNRADPLGLDCGDPDAVHIYHGTLDADALRQSGFTTKDKYGGEALPPYVCVTTDRRAAEDALNPRTRYDAADAPAPEVLAGSMSRAEWDRLHKEGHLSTNDYGGFGGTMKSTETKARTPEGVAALNEAFGLPGAGKGG